jgi:hypothetical protein
LFVLFDFLLMLAFNEIAYDFDEISYVRLLKI